MELRTPEPPPDALPWSKGVAPRYIALFLLVVYFDQLPRRTLTVGGLLPSAGGLVLGAILAVLLFFRPLARLGLASRCRLEQACARAFGQGMGWLVPGLVLGLVHIVWFAVAIDYAIDMALRGLAGLRLIDGSLLETQEIGGREVPGGLFLWVAVAWSIASALLGLVTYRLVAAVMAGYQPLVAVALAVAAGWALTRAGRFDPTGVDPVTQQTATQPALLAAARMVELVLGFFATHAALAVDWGRSSRERADVEIGGWVGVALAAVTTGCLALLIVAGAHGPSAAALDRAGSEPEVAGPTPREGTDLGQRAADFTVREALSRGLLPAPLSGVLFLVMGVALLGPACFAPLLIARFLALVAPAVPRWVWTLTGALASWPLIVLRVPERLDLVFTGLGVTIGPIVGVLAADWWRTRGREIEAENVRLPGLMAWLAGMALGGVVAIQQPVVGPAVPTLAAHAAACGIAFLLRGHRDSPRPSPEARPTG